MERKRSEILVPVQVRATQTNKKTPPKNKNQISHSLRKNLKKLTKLKIQVHQNQS